MKKLLLTTALVAIFGFTSMAQEQGDIRATLGLAAGTEAGLDEDTGEAKLGLGINIGGEYVITDGISVAPSYTYFFKNEVGGIETNLSSINIDARYYFGDSGVYGLAGFASLKAKAEGGGFTAETTESGLNIGAGVMYPLSDNLFANGQVKYQTPGNGQLVINLGVSMGF